MSSRDPFKFYKREGHLKTLHQQLTESQHRPRIRLTQGGSSRKDPGARVAATNGLYRKPK